MTFRVCGSGTNLPLSNLVVVVVVAAAAALALAASGCGTKTTEIILVIDTDLGVPAEMDRLQISVTGPTQSADPISVDLTAPGIPAFPMTLGLTPTGALSPVTLHVDGVKSGVAVVTREVRTGFADGKSRTLYVLLTLSCLGAACPTNQTCSMGICTSVDSPGDSLPPFKGVPKPVDAQAALIGARSVWAAGWHSCGTKGDTFSCWGRNDNGELGIGSTQRVPTRRAVTSLPKLSSIGLGQRHSCVCDQAGKVLCWGRNAEGQLGTGDLQEVLTPVPVIGLDDCVQITGGGFHTCAVRAGGSVSCWGRNNEGQTGQPAGTTPVLTPVPVPGLSAVVEVRAGEAFTCARRTNSAILCWGDNSSGQLGDGTQTSRDTPGRVMNLPDGPTELVAGRFFACARSGTGHVSCWGENTTGVIGTAPNPSTLPVEISGINDALQIAAGHQHACVLHVNGNVSCWGSNQYGQLGDGSGLNSVMPVGVADIPGDATSLAVGIVHSCARRANTIVCWGQNVLQQLGDGSGGDQTRPVPVVGF
jgi:alpha-tubulin suppressor-like RCC1 family protein